MMRNQSQNRNIQQADLMNYSSKMSIEWLVAILKKIEV